MNNFNLFASPWWVNLLILVPVSLFFYWRKQKLKISKQTLIIMGIFGIAFAFVESACVIYLRASTGLLPGYMQSLSAIQQQSSGIYSQQILRENLPASLYTIEFLREMATIIMLASVTLLAANKIRERIAIFLWIFAIWDIFYYFHLFWTVRWPENLTTTDVLFLVPVPWISQVWFPILISSITLIVIYVNTSFEGLKLKSKKS